MAIHQVQTENYTAQLAEKQTRITEQFARFDLPDIEVFASEVSHYRQRAEFKIWQQDGRANYAMYEPGAGKKPYVIEEFPVGSVLINNLMPRLMGAVNSDEQLRQRLFQIEFLTTKSGEALITMIYHKPLTDEWEVKARQLKQTLGADIIGRSRKQKLLLNRDYVLEQLEVDGEQLTYKQIEGGFTQPNAGICEKMLNWAKTHTLNSSGDLLELYCGNGNFTVPLSRNFKKVLATEIAKTSVAAAKFNFEHNGVSNVSIARMSSEDFTQAIDGVRPFRRLQEIDLPSYNFSTIFVDPPRAGLDEDTVKLCARFDTILYISCNPQTLADNLDSLSKSHQVEKFALFDQFPYTQHVECGAILRRK